MTTYAQVLLKKELIISLAKQFGFTGEVKIHYDLPDEEEDKIGLRFIVTHARDDLSYKNRSLLAGKLSAELCCDVSVIAQEGIENLYIYDYDRKSALITDERAIKEVIYKINKGIAKEDSVDANDVNLINLEEIECKDISENDKWLQEGLLKQADEYLRKNVAPQNPSVSSAAYRSHSLLPPEKKHKHDKDGDNSDYSKENDKKKLRSSLTSENREVPIGTPNIRKSS